MQLTDEQKKSVKQWVAEGATLSEVQKRVGTEFKIPLTFMDVRLLVLDLGIEIKERKAAAAPVDLSKTKPIKGKPSDPIEADDIEASVGGVAVDLDRVMKPGAVASGTVTFSDGVHAAWMLDQLGRLALDAKKPGYRPSPEDLQSFQVELSRLIQGRGY